MLLATALTLVHLAIFMAFQPEFSSVAKSKWMVTNFTCGPGHRAYTLFTCIFAHMSWWHILSNMDSLQSIGPVVYESILNGPGHFLFFYMTSGVLCSLAHWAYMRAQGKQTKALGASGAICALVGLATHIPYMRGFSSFLQMKVTLRQSIILSVFRDMFLMYLGNSGICHVAHITGYLVGVLYPYGIRQCTWDAAQACFDFLKPATPP